MVAFIPPDFKVSTTTAPTPTITVETTDAKKSFVLSKEECQPIIRIGKNEKEKVINLFGLWCLFVSLLTFPIWMVAMTMVSTVLQPKKDDHYALFDSTGKVWAKVWLSLTNSYPTISGGTIQPHQIEPPPPPSQLSSTTNTDTTTKDMRTVGACLYVANHASWLDIPILCTVLDPVFKFIAKGELRNVPGIGQQLQGVSTRV